MADIVKAVKISKSFNKAGGKLQVLRAVSFAVKQGEVLILTGKNGSGKTTLLKILSGLLLPDQGEVLLNGFNPKAVKRTIGYLGSDERALYLKLTGRQNLEFFAELYGVDDKTIAERIQKLMELLKMESYIDLPVENFSLGMKQRLALAKTLIHHPRICLFDEPVKGLDKAAKKIFIDLLKLLIKKKNGIIIATHNEADFKGIKYKVRELGR
ncbi:MAG: ABC transporter ATP-binding protein [Candidatus Firestonebacteria bacterium]